MFRFDWLSFIKAHKIPYVTSGPNTAKNHISIKCCWCGNDDPSEHLGLSLNENAPAWGCLRNQKHRGQNVMFLVQKLLNCSKAIAAQEVARFSGGPMKPALSEVNEPIIQPGDLILPTYFKPVTQGPGNTNLFWQYLEGRGFMAGHIQELVNRYRLHCCMIGEWNMRLLIPLFFEGRLMSWTGRSIHKDEGLRYKTLSREAGHGYKAKMRSADLLFDYDNLELGGKALFICEGPFDAMKVGFYAAKANMRATCLFTNGISENQMILLAKLRDKYEQFIVLLDPDAQTQSMHIAGELAALLPRVRRVTLEAGFKDPGDLPMQGVIHLCAAIATP